MGFLLRVLVGLLFGGLRNGVQRAAWVMRVSAVWCPTRLCSPPSQALFTLCDFRTVFETLTGRQQKPSIGCNSRFNLRAGIAKCEHWKHVIRQALRQVTDSDQISNLLNIWASRRRAAADGRRTQLFDLWLGVSRLRSVNSTAIWRLSESCSVNEALLFFFYIQLIGHLIPNHIISFPFYSNDAQLYM